MKRKDAGKSKKADSVRKIGENSKREEILQKAGAYSAVFFMAFFVALVSASAFTPVDKTNADTSEVSLGYSNEGYSISLASFGNNESDVLDPKVGMTLTGTPAGEIAVEYDRLKVTTNSTTYKLYLGMSDTSQKLLNTSETGSGEYCENAASTASCYFSATANTPSGANALDVNTWGFAIPTKYGFDGEYITSGGKKSNGAEAITDAGPGEYVSASSKFAAVPTVANSVMIATGNQKAEQGKNYYIYYGIKADTGKVSGTYEGTVVYTALAEASDSADGKITSVVPDGQQTLDNSSLPVAEQRIMLTTSLYGSEEMISKVQDENDVTVTIGGKTCANPELSVPGNTGTGPIQVSCAQPTMNRWGSYDVAVTIGSYGSYNLRAGYSYYIPWAEMEAHPGEYTMQQFTTKACGEVNTPAATAGGHVVGSYYDKSKPSWYGEDGAETLINPVKQIILTDSRDGRTYQVRKLADGNCWMAQNLELTFYTKSNPTVLNPDPTTDADQWSSDNTTRAVAVANGKTVLTSVDTDLNTVDSLDIVNSEIAFYATQKVANGDSTLWSVDGHDGMRSFSHAGRDENYNYAYNDGTLTDYGQILFSNSNISREPNDGEETRRGNLYNWTAVTLASGESLSTSGVEALDSICPANWQLPTGNLELTNSQGKKYSFYNLLRTYYTGEYREGNINASTAMADREILVLEQNIMRSEPISAIPSGLYHHNMGRVNNVSMEGSFWSATVQDLTYARLLRSFGTFFSARGSDYRGAGYSVRCVAR